MSTPEEILFKLLGVTTFPVLPEVKRAYTDLEEVFNGTKSEMEEPNWDAIVTEGNSYLPPTELDYPNLHKTLFTREELLNSYKALLPDFLSALPYGHDMLEHVLRAITRTDVDWSSFTELDCRYRVRDLILNDLLAILKLITSRDLRICYDKPLTLVSYPPATVDMMIMENDTNLYCIQVKSGPLLDVDKRNSDLSNIEYKDFPESTKKFVDELLGYELRSGCGIGVLTDSFYYISVMIDFEYLDNLPSKLKYQSTNQCPFKYFVLSPRSSCPSLQQILLLQIFQSIRYPVPYKLKAHFRTLLEPRRQNTASSNNKKEPDANFLENTSMDTEDSLLSLKPETLKLLALNVSELKNLVYQTKAKYLRDAIGNSFPDDEELVVKIFANNKINGYNNERKSIDLLTKDPNFNSCYISHKHGIAKVIGEENIKGSFIISRYIEDTEYFPYNVYRKIIDQVDVLRDKGMIPRDIKRDNMLFDAKEGKIYFIDFERTFFRGKDDPPCQFGKLLEECFRKVERLCTEYTQGGWEW